MSPRRVVALVLPVAAIVMLASRRAPAQAVRGTVRDSASGAPVRGAVVTAIDGAGSAIARTLTNERGSYRLALARRAARLQLLRLGYRPTSVRLSDSVGLVTLDVLMPTIPTLLPGVTISASGVNVSTSGRCRDGTDARAALDLLDQVRAGLLSMVVARDSNPARVVRLGYVRDLDPLGEKILRQRVRLDSADRATTSFDASRKPAEFVRLGFRAADDGRYTLFGPDADVLLDDDFAAGYCFRLVSDSARRGQVGLGFTPNSRKRGRIDIDGALWVDTLARQLVDIRFRYLGLDEVASRMGAGGQIGFREMPSGVLFIDRWWLRLVGAPERSPPDPDGRRVIREFSLSETGGELATASWRDGERYVAPLATAQFHAVNDSGAPMAGVTIGLLGTDYRAITDNLGRATISTLLPGPYVALVADARLAPVGLMLPASLAFETKRSSTVIRRFVVPKAESYVARACGHELAEAPPSLLARAQLQPGDPPTPFHWRLRISDGGRWRTIADVRNVGAEELFQQCSDLATGDLVEVEVTRARQAPERLMRRIERGLNVIPVSITSAADAARARTSVTLMGVVRDSMSHAPVNEARVAVAGTYRETITDSAGRFMLAGMPRGEYELEVGSPWLDSIGAVKRVRITVTERAAPLLLHMPSASQIASAACGESMSAGVIVGRVGIHPDSGDVAGVPLVAEWTETSPGPAQGSVTLMRRSLRTRTGAHGTFRFCGVPFATAIHLRSEADSTDPVGAAPAPVFVDAERRFARMDLSLTRVPRNMK